MAEHKFWLHCNNGAAHMKLPRCDDDMPVIRRRTTRQRLAIAAAMTTALLLAGCTLGPDYEQPRLAAVPVQWEAPQPHGGDLASLADWWAQLDDPVLVQLQQTAEDFSPSLGQAVARIDQARASLATSRADGLPRVDGSGSYSVAGQIDIDSGDETDENGNTVTTGDGLTITSDGLQAGLDASWEIDLFGKVRRQNQAERARIEARVDDWHDARVSLSAEVADYYVQLRGCEQLADLYDQQSSSQDETARLTRISADAGFTAPADARLTEASAASTRASLKEQRAQCDLLVKSLVTLTGMNEGELRALLAPGRGELPGSLEFRVESVPADLVRQRPDVAAAERELAATSAEIGAAEADLYPSLSLGGSISLASGVAQWSFGPSLSLPTFDGGRARAGVRSAEASYNLQYHSYREAVWSAVLEVEQSLVQLDAARGRADDAAEAAAGYQDYFTAIERLRQVGSANVLDLESARRNALDARRNLVSLRTATAQYWIALYKALGGGWDEAQSPNYTIPAGDQTS